MATFMDYIKKEILAGFPTYVFNYFDYMAGTQNRSERTIKGYALDLRAFYDYLITNSPIIKKYDDVTTEFLDNLTIKDIQEYMSYLRSGTRYDGVELHEEASARARKLSSLRGFMQYLYNNKDLKVNVARLVDGPKIPHHKKGRLSGDQVCDILDRVMEPEQAPEKQKGYLLRSKKRDYAILLLLSHSGIRVSELVNLDIDDIDYRNLTITVTRKGGNRDIVYINEEVIAALSDYIENERRDLDNEHALFLSSRTGNPGRLSVSAVERLVKKFGSGISINKVTPHTMRRTFGTSLYLDTGDINLTANALGHKNINTTAKYYVEIDEERKQMVRNVSYTRHN